MNDQQFKYYLEILIFYNDYILGESRQILADIDILAKNIDKEPERLE
jgi:hypothetical protein